MSASRYRRRHQHRIAEMNVVPYIDVMLVLLIIFMITTPLLVEGVNVELPKVNMGSDQIKAANKGELIVVSLDATGNIYFQQNKTEPLTPEALVDKLINLLGSYKSQYPNDPPPVIYLKADKELSYGQVMGTMALLKGKGIERVSLVVEKTK